MQSVIDNIGGYGIRPLSFYNECETGCNRAVPDNEVFISLILGMLKGYQENPNFFVEEGERIRQNAISHYTWIKPQTPGLKDCMKLKCVICQKLGCRHLGSNNHSQNYQKV